MREATIAHYLKVNKSQKASPCGLCKKMRTKIIRKGGSEPINKNRTFPKQFSYVCTNRKCSNSINMAKVKTWVITKIKDEDL